ncbi:hypothetical protein L208DRAFT_1216319, partial [Tricholoma matsutake]
HDEALTHSLTVKCPSAHLVVVPVGPAIPRCDQPHAYPCYCYLMLLLFKLWCMVEDLRIPGETWVTMFQSFLMTQSPDGYVWRVMDNMQLLHECKDSCDDHFVQRR